MDDATTSIVKPPALELEYETHFFNFSPKALLDSIYNIFDDAIERRLGRLKVDLVKHFDTKINNGEMSEDEIVLAVGRIQATLINDFLRPSFDVFEKFALEYIFHIPNYVLLPEHEIYDGEQFTESDMRQLRDEIDQLEVRIKSLQFVNAALKAELNETKFVKEYQAKLLDSMGKVFRKLEEHEKENIAKESLINECLTALKEIE